MHLCEVKRVPAELLCLFKRHHLGVQCPGGLQAIEEKEGRLFSQYLANDVKVFVVSKRSICIHVYKNLKI